MGNVNHRGWIVLDSVASDDSTLCVDFFEDPGGGYGFEHFRADPEDRGGWTAVGGFAGTRYPTLPDVAAAAMESIPWLTLHPEAKRSFESWRSSFA